MNKQLTPLLLCILGTISTSAYGDQPSVYVGAGIGYGQTTLQRPATATSFERNGMAWSIFTGYKGNKILSPEIGYVRMKNVVASAGSARDTVEPWFGYAAIKATTSNHTPYHVFGKLGAAYAYGKETLVVNGQTKRNHQHKTVAYGALGVDYSISPTLSLDMSASSTTKRGTVPRMSAGIVGLAYHLDQEK